MRTWVVVAVARRADVQRVWKERDDNLGDCPKRAPRLLVRRRRYALREQLDRDSADIGRNANHPLIIHVCWARRADPPRGATAQRLCRFEPASASGLSLLGGPPYPRRDDQSVLSGRPGDGLAPMREIASLNRAVAWPGPWRSPAAHRKDWSSPHRSSAPATPTVSSVFWARRAAPAARPARAG